MHIVTLRTVGGSTMVAIPKAILEGLGLAANAKVGLRIDRGQAGGRTTAQAALRACRIAGRMRSGGAAQ